MKNTVLAVFAFLCLSACQSKNTADTANLPKDISLKPENNLTQQHEREQLSNMIKEIEGIIASENCSDVSQWKFAAIGAKPCGGASSYIAYPEKKEAEILGKIEEFTRMQTAFNKKYQLVSDCMMVMPPSEIKCVDGRAVLISGNSAIAKVQ